MSIQTFETYAWDVDDWNYAEHLTVPNPDFGRTGPGTVEPKAETVVVYQHAKRVEDAGLAAPYKFRTNAWRVTDASIVGPADVDPARRI